VEIQLKIIFQYKISYDHEKLDFIVWSCFPLFFHHSGWSNYQRKNP